MVKQFRGIYAIPPTPFDENLELDIDSLRNLIDFCCESGAHGIVTPVNASEFTSLSDKERMKVVEVAAKQNADRLPFVAGVSGITAKAAAMFASHARECGARALIAMPPYINKATEPEIFQYYQAISDAGQLPIFIQNYVPPVGTPMSAQLMIRMVREIEHVQYVKEETQYAGLVITQLNEQAKALPEGRYMGVMGGKAGRYLLDEYRRGACGNMPACEVADVQAKIWNALEEGREDLAEEMFNKIITLLNFEYLYGAALYKEVLKRRGVIRTARFRQCSQAGLDAIDMVEFERIMSYVKDMFTL